MAFLKETSIAIKNNQIAVALGHGLLGGHAGIVFHAAKEGMFLLHLRFHNDLALEPFPRNDNGWLGCVVDLPPHASTHFVGMLRSLSKKKPKIGYGLNILFGQNAFDDKNRYRPPAGHDGLTCATFIVELFKSAGLPLIELTSWDTSPANLCWGEAICCLLTVMHPSEIEHIAAVKRSNSGMRVTPEEVAAAADMPYGKRPVHFHSLARQALTVAELVAATCTKPPVRECFAKCVEIYERENRPYVNRNKFKCCCNP